MKMNKKECRKFADLGPALPPDHGLVCAKQVDYIIRTAVKLIGHHRTLVLYIYDRERAAQGDLLPLWTMFQGKDDYITLARRPDGTTSWRTAAFENLGDDYYFVDKCAFYSAKDQERLARFFHSDAPDFWPLVRAQTKLLERRQKQRERKRDQAVQTRMEVVPAMPRKLATWAHRNIMPAYFFYDHARKGEAVGACTSCGKEATLTGVKHNATGVCPHCGRPVTMKHKGRIRRLEDRTTFQVIQRTGPEELVVRIFKARTSYGGERPGTLVQESARQFVRVSDGKVQHEHFYYGYSESKWKQGDRPAFYPYSYNFEADTCGHVYCRGLSKALAGTPWQYCPVQEFYEHFHEPMEMSMFLAAYLEHPRLEHLVKVGFFNLASDLVYRGRYGHKLDEAQDRTHRVLGVGAEDVAFLRGLDVDMTTLKIFQGYCQQGLKDRQRLLTWQLEREVQWNIDTILEHMTVHKAIRYLEGQWSFLRLRLTQAKNQRYRTMQDLVTEYKDYLEMCVKQGYDMKNSFVLYPKDLQKSHDKVAHRIKLKADAKLRRDFKAAYQKIMGHLDFELDGMRVVYPATPEEIVAEGHALHHCVGNYVNSFAQQKSMILFLRRCEDLSKPFYTVEVKGQKAVQVRGMRNADVAPEVGRFIRRWERQVLQGQDLEVAA